MDDDLVLSYVFKDYTQAVELLKSWLRRDLEIAGLKPEGRVYVELRWQGQR